MNHQNRAFGIDILRLFCCIGIVCCHWVHDAAAIGPYFVIAFFVMSGFLLAPGFFQKTHVDFLNFYRKKSRQLLPMLLMALFLGFIMRMASCCLHPQDHTLLPQWSAQQWSHFDLVGFVYYYNGPCWYMVVEIYFLLSAPFLLSLITIPQGQLRLALPLFFLLFAYLLSFTGYSHSEHYHRCANGFYFSPFCHLWEFFFGMVAYVVSVRLRPAQRLRPQQLRWISCILGGIAVGICLMLFSLDEERDLGFLNYSLVFDTGVTLFFGVLVMSLYYTRIAMRESIGNSLLFLSSLTYPVYLTHGVVAVFSGYIMQKIGVSDSVVSALLASVVATALLSILMQRIQSKFFNHSSSQIAR